MIKPFFVVASQPLDPRKWLCGAAEQLGDRGASQKYGKNASQIILRFEVQESFITLPKSSTPERIKSNINIFDFALTDEEMNSIRMLDTGNTSHDPDAPGVGETLMNALVVED